MSTPGLTQKWRQTLACQTPGQLVIQITDRCNAACPQCGMRASSDFPRSTLEPGDVLRTIDAAAARNIKAISFTGGEPLLFPDTLCAYMNRAGRRGIPWIRTGTNGFLFAGSARPGFQRRISRLVEKLAATPIRNFWISIDSHVPEVHESMRGFDGLIKGIKKAIPIFHDAGIFPSANLGINRNLGGHLTRDLHPGLSFSPREYEDAVYDAYARSFSTFYETIISLGFTIVNACYPMSIDDSLEPGSHDLEAVYRASATDSIVRYTAAEKAVIFQVLKDTIPKFRHRIRIFSPLVSLKALAGEYNGSPGTSSPCQGGINYHFIDACTGNTFPCGFRGRESRGRFWQSACRPGGLQPDCRRCDWECFRDPSELAAPLLNLASSPLSFARKTAADPGYLALWLNDLLYYRACDYFNGRKAPDYRRMKRFSSQALPCC